MKMSPRLVLATLLLLVSIIGVASFPKKFYIGDPYWMRAQAQAWLEGRDDIPAQYASQLEVGQYCFYNFLIVYFFMSVKVFIFARLKKQPIRKTYLPIYNK